MKNKNKEKTKKQKKKGVNPILYEYIVNYLEYLRLKNYTESTIKTYEINLRYFYSFIKEKEKDYLSLKGTDMIEYIATMKKYKPATKNLRLTSLRQFYEYLIDLDIVQKNPVRQSLFIRTNRIKPRPITSQEKRALTLYLQGQSESIQLGFKVLYESGIRVGELTQLKKENFFQENNKSYIYIEKSKNFNQRIVPIPNKLYNEIIEFAEKYIYFGVIFDTKTRTYQYHAEKFAKKYDNKFTIHSLRHTYATRKAKEGVPIQIIQKLLGHKSINTTLFYIEVTDKDIMEL